MNKLNIVFFLLTMEKRSRLFFVSLIAAAVILIAFFGYSFMKTVVFHNANNQVKKILPSPAASLTPQEIIKSLTAPVDQAAPSVLNDKAINGLSAPAKKNSTTTVPDDVLKSLTAPKK